MLKSRDYMKVWLRFVNLVLRQVFKISDQVSTHHCPRPKWCWKRGCSDWLQILLKQRYLRSLCQCTDEKAREFNLGTAFAHQNAEVWQVENQQDWSGYQRTEWTEKAWVEYLGTTVLQVSQNRTSTWVNCRETRLNLQAWTSNKLYTHQGPAPTRPEFY